MKRFFNSLTFKIGIIVILAETATLTAIGFYYIDRFSSEIEQRIETQIKIPGMLMSRGLLEFESVADKEIMGELVGGEFTEGLVIGLDNRVFYSLNPDYAGRKVTDIPEKRFIGQLDEHITKSQTAKIVAGQDNYFVSLTPLNLEDKSFVNFLYIRVGTARLEHQKNVITTLFLFGSILCILFTSLVIIFAFNSIVSTRIKRLLHVLARVESGDLTARVEDPILEDEIGQVQAGVNAMVAQLEGTFASLEQNLAELMQTEAALRESERRYRQSVENSPNPIFSVDRKGLIQTWNRACQQIFQYEAAEIVGQTYHKLLWNPEDRSLIQAKVAQVFQKQSLRSVELSYRCKNGSQRFTVSRLFPLLDRDGSVEGCTFANTDITERRQAEEALRLSEERFREMAESIREVFWLFDWIDQRVIYVSPAYEEIWGRSIHDLYERYDEWGKSIHPDDLANATESFGQIIQTGGGEIREYRIIRPSGEIRWISDRGFAITNAAGLVVRIAGIAEDITDRKRAEEALRNAEWEKQTILDSQLDHVVYQDKEHKILWLNQAACQSVGATREQLIGRYCYQIWPRRNQPCPDCPVALARDTGQVTQGEIATPDGRIWFIRGYPVRDLNGQLIGAIEVTQEITEQVQAREEIRRLNEELEQRVFERTAQLEAANRELEAFAYSVSHDLRAPLRSINGFSQALLEDYAGSLGAAGQDYLQRVRAASQRMGQLIDALLKLSRLTRHEMRFEAVDLSALAEEVAAELQQTEPERQAEFSIKPGLMADGDARLLHVVVENLLSNAWKFTAKRADAKIEFGWTELDPKSTFFVRDNGVGFDMAYADKLFGAFQRLHPATEFEGTGIGLATVQRIIHRHGGHVWAEGEVDKGATFYFTL